MRQLWQHFDYGLTDLQFDECGIQQFEPYQVYQYTVYQPYIIHWIASGKGSLEVDNHCQSGIHSQTRSASQILCRWQGTLAQLLDWL